MSKLVARTATLIVGGVTIGVTLGAAICAALPIWLALPTLVAVGIAIIYSTKEKSHVSR